MNLFKNKQNIFIIILFIIFSFSCGYLIGRKEFFQQIISNYKNNNKILVSQDINNLLTSDNKSDFSSEDLKIFNEAFSLISKNYYSYDSITKKELIN